MYRWKIERGQSSAQFSIRHFLFWQVQGQFRGISGSLHYNPNRPESASVEATLTLDSLTTGSPQVDHFIRGQVLHSDIHFRSDRVRFMSDDQARISGRLSVNDQSFPVTLEAARFDQGYTDNGQQSIHFSGACTLSRDQIGLRLPLLVDALVGRAITIRIEIAALHQTVAETS